MICVILAFLLDKHICPLFSLCCVRSYLQNFQLNFAFD